MQKRGFSYYLDLGSVMEIPQTNNSIKYIDRNSPFEN